MDVTQQIEDEQTKLWNGPAARAWIDTQEVLDHMFIPFADLLVEAVAGATRNRVLDVGCGTGSTTLAVVRPLGGEGRCTGIDISAPMIAVARASAERESSPASFLCGNGETYAFEPASFDMIISRFGVMFFGDSVRAFTNLRRAATEDARLRFIAWRSAAENSFMTAAERAAASLLPGLSSRRQNEPGQFAFADRNRVHSILKESGWAEIDIHPIDIACTLPTNGLLTYVTRLGPVSRILQEADDRTRALVVDTVLPAFDKYVNGSEVRFSAACWMVDAQASATRNRISNA